MQSNSMTVPDILIELVRNGGGELKAIREHSGSLAPTMMLLAANVLLAFFYGAGMGFGSSLRQALSSAVKMPFLFLGPLAICFPAIIMTSLMTGESFGVVSLLNVLLATITRALLAMAALAPIAVFFGFGSSYSFMKLLHVAVISISAILALAALHQALAGEGGALRFALWTALYAFVAAQLAWKLRPFLGEPNHPFEWIRRGKSDMNFYSALYEALQPRTPPPGAGISISG